MYHTQCEDIYEGDQAAQHLVRVKKQPIKAGLMWTMLTRPGPLWMSKQCVIPSML